jgi:ribosomal 50S subunit-associated protein YjgA (DUF615 family)
MGNPDRFRNRGGGFRLDSHNGNLLCKDAKMANLTLVYGMRLLPEGEVKQIQDATLKLANGNEAHVTMHVLEGSREQIEAQLKQSLDAFFDFYPEI